MELMAMLPALLGTAGGAMNMINGAPANNVRPGQNPLQMAGQLFGPAMNMGLGAVGGMPNIFADTLPQFGDTIKNMMGNPGTPGMIGGANAAAGMGADVSNSMMGLGNFLANMGTSLTPWAGNLLNQGAVQNPNAGSLMQGAQGAARMGGEAANSLFSTGQTMQGVGQNLLPFAGQILNAGFDPQNALRDRTQQQLLETTRAGQAARGLGNSPFGAGLENKAMSDFGIDWQNNLLSRMTTGAQGAGALLGQGGNYMLGGSGLMSQAPGLLGQTSALPYQAGSTILSDIMRSLTGGAQGAGLLLDQAGRDITGGASLMGQAPQMMSQSSMLPYMAHNTIGQGQLGALQQYGQQGIAATQQPQQQLQDFFQLIGLGNAGANVGNNIFGNQLNQANMGFNQQRQQGQDFGNAIAGLGKAFGGGGMGGGGGNQFMPTPTFMQNGMGWG